LVFLIHNNLPRNAFKAIGSGSGTTLDTPLGLQISEVGKGAQLFFRVVGHEFMERKIVPDLEDWAEDPRPFAGSKFPIGIAQLEGAIGKEFPFSRPKGERAGRKKIIRFRIRRWGGRLGRVFPFPLEMV